MKTNDLSVMVNHHDDDKAGLKSQVQRVVTTQNLDAQCQTINAIAAELKISVLVCAGAIAYLNETNSTSRSCGSIAPEPIKQGPTKPLYQLDIKQVRYRLDLGLQHQVTTDLIKKVLVEESGVDIEMITNIRMMDTYTLVDLPDEMPQEIFHHLRLVEINGKELDIRRVKPRNKKRGNRRHRSLRTPLTAAEKVS